MDTSNGYFNHSERIEPSPNPTCFANCKGMLELVGIYNNDSKELGANYRKWALRYHPDKGNGEKDFFSLVTNCVKVCVEHLEKRQSTVAAAGAAGYEAISFPTVKENDRIRFENELGQTIHGIVVQLHPQWSVDKTHLVITKTTQKWEPDLQSRKMYVAKETIKGLLRCKHEGTNGHGSASSSSSSPSSSSSSPSSASVQGVFEEVSWRELQPGDKIHVQYVSLKDPSTLQQVFGIFKSAPTYSDVVEFVKTDQSFAPSSRAVTVIPLAGSMCRFHRLNGNNNNNNTVKKRKL